MSFAAAAQGADVGQAGVDVRDPGADGTTAAE